MKANELMIGDWVIVNSIPVKVEFIEDTDSITYMCKEYGELLTTKNFNPIPLTMEILEKNGFAKKSNKAFRYADEEARIEMDFYRGNGLFNITKYLYLDDEITYSFPEPYYIHELQHALRLCGQNDLANNFKI